MGNAYTISHTSDYNAFSTVLGNRKVRPAHVKKLRLAIEADPETIKYNPILVNERMEVVDGQHRLEAIKQLGLEVHYVRVPGLGLHNVQQLNSVAKQWQPVDYAAAFAKLGNENYARYLDLKVSDYSLNHDSLIRYLALDNPITSQSFKEGRLKVEDFDKTVTLLEQLFEVGEFYDRFKIRSFALAFLRLASAEEYDHKRMVEQMKNYGRNFLEDFSKEQDYFKALNKVYNFRKRAKRYFASPEYLMA